MVEVALILPILSMFLLAAVDLAQVYSAKQRLEHAAHLAVRKLLNKANLNLVSDIASEAGFPASAITATASYAADANGDDQVTVTAAYDYPLILPGLRNLQTRSINNGKLHVVVQAADLARTDPPAITTTAIYNNGNNCDGSGNGSIRGYCFTVAPATGTATPSALTNLTCTLYDNGSAVASVQKTCSTTTPLSYGPVAVTSGDVFSAVITQLDGLASSRAQWVAP